MSKIGIFYGSSTGSTSEVAQRLAKALGAEANVYDVAGADAADAAAFDVLLLGSSTWGIGDLQDDWEDFLPKLAEQSLAGKKVALFGCGDADSYPDSFCEALAKIHEASLVRAAPSSGLMSPKATATMLLKRNRMASSSVSASTKLTSLTSPTNVSKSGSLCCSRSSKSERLARPISVALRLSPTRGHGRRATFCIFRV